MTSYSRATSTTSPVGRLDADLADWCVAIAELPYCDHIVSWKDRVVLIDPPAPMPGDKVDLVDWFLAHCFAHIDHEHGHDGSVDRPFSPRECLDMNGVARMALGLDVLGLGAQPDAAVPASDTA